MRFEKWQGLGNDYLIVEAPELPFALDARSVASLCHPQYGIDCDGLVVVDRAPSKSEAVAKLRVFNPDGSRCVSSSNGTRQAILYLRAHGWTCESSFVVLTDAGPIRPTIHTDGGLCEMELGRYVLRSPHFPSGSETGRGSLIAAGRTWDFQHIAIGDAQCAIQVSSVEELNALDVPLIGLQVERHPLFPLRTNVSFSCLASEDVVAARIFERGIGETLSSDTGAAGAAVTALLAGSVTPITVAMPGGALRVQIDDDWTVHLAGSASCVFSGVFSDQVIESLRPNRSIIS